jgi:hypothetical protein
VGGEADPGYGLGVLTRASGLGSLFQHADAGSALTQICRQRYPVGPATHDNEVIPFILAHRFLPFGDATLPDPALRDPEAASDLLAGAEETDTQRLASEEKLPLDHGFPVKSIPLYDI